MDLVDINSLWLSILRIYNLKSIWMRIRRTITCTSWDINSVPNSYQYIGQQQGLSPKESFPVNCVWNRVPTMDSIFRTNFSQFAVFSDFAFWCSIVDVTRQYSLNCNGHVHKMLDSLFKAIDESVVEQESIHSDYSQSQHYSDFRYPCDTCHLTWSVGFFFEFLFFFVVYRLFYHHGVTLFLGSFQALWRRERRRWIIIKLGLEDVYDHVVEEKKEGKTFQDKGT